MRRMLLLTAALAVLLCGCQKKETPAPEESAETQAQETPPQETQATLMEQTVAEDVDVTVVPHVNDEETDAPADQTEPVTDAVQPEPTRPVRPHSEDRPVREVYQEALSDLLDYQLFPDETPAMLVGEMEENSFAISDVDGDGREELVILFTAASVENMCMMILDMDEDGLLYKELTAFPGVTLFDNGLATLSQPENDGFSGRFWPYTVAVYHPESDGWEETAYVCALDQRLMEEQGVADEYPEEADTSGTGLVYCIGSDMPVDVTEYNDWRESLFGEATALELTFLPLTREQVDAII